MSNLYNNAYYKKKPSAKKKSTPKKKPKPIQSRGMGYVVKDIIKRVTRGGLETDKRTKKHTK